MSEQRYSQRTFEKVFQNGKPVLGVIHCSGSSDTERLERVCQELDVFSEAKVTGILFENYHCSRQSLVSLLDNLPLEKWQKSLIYGIKVLPNESEDAFMLATKYKFSFVQLDYISGVYTKEGDSSQKKVQLDINHFRETRKKYPSLIVLGGVHPKNYHPIPGSHLYEDLQTAMSLCEAIVVTGEANGSETPLSKILQFRQMVGKDFPLVVGSGINPSNVQEQLSIANGCIVGSAFKSNGNSEEPVQLKLVHQIMSLVQELKRETEGIAHGTTEGETTKTCDEEVQEVLLHHRINKASNALNKSYKGGDAGSFLPMMTQLLKENQLFEFPWKCIDCHYINEQMIINCEVCTGPNPYCNTDMVKEVFPVEHVAEKEF
jgi:predicted TIM-barrel enzyme